MSTVRRDGTLGTLVGAAGASFLVVGFLGRLPAAMNQLGLLLVVSASGRGLALAGTTVAAVGLGTALSAPVVGRLVDRHGPVSVLTAALVLQVAGLAGVLACLSRDLPGAALLACAALVGLANPQAGSVARATWSALARRDPDPARSLRTVRAGLGFESAADETSFVIGPVAAGCLVAVLGAEGTTVALGVVTVVGEGLLAVWLARRPGLLSAAPHAPRAATPVRGELVPVLLAVLAVGVVFGTTQTALTAVHTAQGTPGLTGPVYGAMGVTSALAGLLSPTWARPAGGKLVIAGLLVAGTSAALMTLPGTALTVVLVLVMGAGVGTALVTGYTLLEQHAQDGHLTSLMTLGSTSNILGVSASSVLTGLLSSHLHAAQAPAVAAGAALVLIGLAGAGPVRARQDRPS